MKKQAVIVLGMHRSGTSAVMRLCNLLGVKIGGKVLPPKDDNEAGFWEHQDVVDLHEKILAEAGSSWDDTRSPLKDLHEFSKDLKKIIKRDFGNIPLWGVKDPRLSICLPLWIQVLKDLEVGPLFILVARDPKSVALSLQKRDGFSVDKSLLLWSKYTLDSELNSRGYKRTFITFEQLTKDWKGTARKIATDLNISWINDFKIADGFIKPSIIHYSGVSSVGDVDKTILDWAENGYETFLESTKTDNKKKEFTGIYKEIKSSLEQSNKFSSFWYEDAQYYKSKWLDESTKRNEDIAELNRQNVAEYTKTKKALEKLVASEIKLNTTSGKLNKIQKKLADTEENLRDAEKEKIKLSDLIEGKEKYIDGILNSKSWKITAPLRSSVTFMRKGRIFLNYVNYIKGFKVLRSSGIQECIRRFSSGWEKVDEKYDYQEWIEKYDTLTEKDKKRIKRNIRSFKKNPLISIVMPVYNVEEKWLTGAIDSVLNQLYENWELCIADDCSPSGHVRETLDRYVKLDSRIKVEYRGNNGHISKCSNTALELATGEFVALMDHDDIIPEHAMYYVAKEINDHPDVDLIYTDEDKIDLENSRYGVYFKSDWNYDLFYGQNMFSHLGVFRRSILTKINGFRKGYEGSQDYDLVLRSLLHTEGKKIRHIPRVLYHWRAVEGSTSVTIDNKSYTVTSARESLQDYLDTIGADALAKEAKIPIFHRVVWAIKDNPKVTLVISMENNVHAVSRCINSIRKTTYSNYEILIVNPPSDDKKVLNFYSKLHTNENIRIVYYAGENIRTFAVRHATGSILGFIDKNIEVIESGWLTEMVSHALRTEVDIVGAKLYSPDGKVCSGIGTTKNDPGYFGRGMLIQTVSSVSPACVFMKKEMFGKIKDFKNLRDYRVVWTPYAELYHHKPEELSERIIKNDPYYNPNLNVEKRNFSLAFPPENI